MRKKKKSAIRASAIVRARWSCGFLLPEADEPGFGLEPSVLLVVALPFEVVEFDAVDESAGFLDDTVVEDDVARIWADMLCSSRTHASRVMQNTK